MDPELTPDPEGAAPAPRRLRRVLGLALSAVLVALLIQGQHMRHRDAELVLRGGGIDTVDAARTWASALAIAEGRIVYVGTDAGVAAWMGPRTVVLDLASRVVLPGFTDAHVHPAEGGVELGRCP
jgi:adenine deaminase